MANLKNQTNWEENVEQTTQNITYSFGTKQTYVDKDISIGIKVPGMNLQNTQNFYLNDGIYTWNWSIDNEGNVLIT